MDKSTFKIINLSNKMADCFFIEIENELCQTVTILVDGNREGAKEACFEGLVETIVSLEKKLDLIIITHVDDDHLGGILRLFSYAETKKDATALELKYKLSETEVIYNYITKGNINYSQAEELEKLLHGYRVSNSCKMFYDIKNKFLNIYRYQKRKNIKIKPSYKFRKVYLTFISPEKEGVNAVIKDYEAIKKKIKSDIDGELVNRNSITFILEFGGKCVVFAADAYWEEVQKKLDCIKDISKVCLIKIPHHGAFDNNKGIVEWAELKKCTKFILTIPDESKAGHPAGKLVDEIKEYRKKAAVKVYTFSKNRELSLCADNSQIIELL